jgi:chromosome segregation ATPase
MQPQHQAGQHAQQLELLAKEYNCVLRQAQERVAELERRAQEHDAALQRQADAAEERVMVLQRQLERTQEEHARLIQQFEQEGQRNQELEHRAREHDAVLRQAQERVAELERRAQEHDTDMQRQADAAEERVMVLQRQLERTQEEHALLLQQQAGRHTQELEQRAMEHDAVVRRAHERMADLERRVREHEADLQRQAYAAGERVLVLQRQLERAQQAASVQDMHSISQAFSGEVSTASYSELAVATRNFAAANILGRGGFGPVYRGEWNGQAVAIKKLDQASS